MKRFISFSAGSENYVNAGKRIIQQAKTLNLFDEHVLYTDKELKDDKEFWCKHGNFIENNKRGYGYWLWKPYIIKKNLDSMNEGDILLYLDAGCELHIDKKDGMIEALNAVEKDLIVGSLTGGGIEYEWCKMDLYEALDGKNSKPKNQRPGGTNMFLVCEKTKNLVNEWYEIATSQNYHLLDDTPSILKNDIRFKEHRHDQAIFSLLTKKHCIFSKVNILEAIYRIRNRTGTSKLKF